MKYLWSILLILCMCQGTAIAAPPQEFATNDPIQPSAIKFDEILLKDGNLLLGKIVEELPDMVVFITDSLGRLEIPRQNIEKLAYNSSVEGAITDPDQNSIMFCPTPASLPKGDTYFRDFELLFLNFGFGVTDNFDLSFGTFFPISSSFFMFSAGAKWRLLDRDIHPVGLALTGSFTKIENLHFGTAGGVIGIGNARRSLNFAVNQTYNDSGDSETVLIIGADLQTARRSKIFVEYFNSSVLFEDDDLAGFLNMGFRLFSQKHSFSLSGFRPLQTDTGGLIAFPMLSYSMHW